VYVASVHCVTVWNRVVVKFQTIVSPAFTVVVRFPPW
jgi:hypothetical protein